MSRLVKIVNNKYVQIEEYKKPNICFNTNEYDNFEDYCTLRETFDPFEIFYENQELKKQVEEKENIACNWKDSCLENAGKIEKLENQQKEFMEYLRKIIVDSKAGSGQQYYAQEHLKMFKEIIGGKE